MHSIQVTKYSNDTSRHTNSFYSTNFFFQCSIEKNLKRRKKNCYYKYKAIDFLAYLESQIIHKTSNFKKKLNTDTSTQDL